MSTEEVRDDFADLVAFSRIVRSGLLPLEYSYSKEFADVIALTSEGDYWLTQVRMKHPTIAESDAKIAILSEFAVEDKILVDVERSDIGTLHNLLHHQCRGGYPIRLPFIYGRTLDDAYVHLFGREPRHELSPEETEQLLKDRPPGVFQVGRIIVGPIGLIKSKQHRYLPPTLYGPVVLCKDPGCKGRHSVYLQPHKTASREAFLDIIPDISLSPGFTGNLRMLLRGGYTYSSDYPGTFPWLLTNGFSFGERKLLLRSVLEANSDGIREASSQIRGSARRSAAQIADHLSESESLQLLLYATDITLAQHLEALIDKGEIVVGSSEIRSPFMMRDADDGTLKVTAEAGRLGVRFVPKVGPLAPLRLRSFLRSLFADTIDELDWILRNTPGDSAFDKLDHYINCASLADIVDRLVMSSRSRVQRTIGLLPYSSMGVPKNEQEEARFVQSVLWKLGNSLPPPPTADFHLRELLQVVEASIDRSSPQVERLALEGVRSGGVNLFVELEGVLTRSIEYSTWLLLNDHFGLDRTHRFRYSASRARSLTAEKINGAHSKPQNFAWDGDGRNTLGTLIEGLRVLAGECEWIKENEEQYRRDASQISFLASQIEIVDFPFIHTCLLLDLTDQSSTTLINTLRSGAAELEQGRIADVRNRFSHARDDFPAPSEIGTACDALNKSTDILGGQGLLPTVYVLASESRDAFGRSLGVMANGDNKELSIQGPSELFMCDLPSLEEPQVISSGARIAGGLHVMRLAIEEDSEFTRMWAGYPAEPNTQTSGEAEGPGGEGGIISRESAQTPANGPSRESSEQ